MNCCSGDTFDCFGALRCLSSDSRHPVPGDVQEIGGPGRGELLGHHRFHDSGSCTTVEMLGHGRCWTLGGGGTVEVLPQCL